MLGTIFSGLALGLAALGLYSVVRYLAVQRFREMGLRMVLGAQANDVLKRVPWKGLQLGALAVAASLLPALRATRVDPLAMIRS